MIDKELYKLYTAGNLIDYSLRYKKGYDRNYLPYLEMNLPDIYNLKTNIGYGIVREGNKESTEMKLDFKYNKTHKINQNWNIELTEQYIQYLYGLSSNQQRSNYSGLLSDITLNGCRQINNKVKIDGSLGWQKVFAEGRYIFADDELEKKELLLPSVELTILTKEPESAYIIEADSKYNMIDKDWDQFKLNLTRKHDCHSLSFSYDLIESYFGFEMSIF